MTPLRSIHIRNFYAICCDLTLAAPCACSDVQRSSTYTSPATSTAVTADTAATEALGPGETIRLVTGEKIWSKLSGSGTGAPDILVHGGLGTRNFHLKSMQGLGVDHAVVPCDQLGAGMSERTTDSTLMVVPRYVDEPNSLRRALKCDAVFLNPTS